MSSQEATQTLPGGITAMYSLSGENGTLYLTVVDSTGRILAADSASFANRDEVVISVTGQIANELRDVRQEVARVQTEIDQLNAIINDPNTDPQDKAFAQTSLTDAKQRKATLDAKEAALYDANLQIGFEFTTITGNLNASAAPPPTAPTPTPTTQTPTVDQTTTSTPSLTGVASDDSGATQPNSAGSTGAPVSASPSAAGAVASGNGNTSPVAPTTPASNGGQGTTGTAGSTTSGPTLRTEASKTQPPGKRLKNPLGYFSSYTYQISLYMITPDGYDAFIQSGRRNINALNQMTSGQNAGGAFLIAQSGGINNTDEDRAPGFAFDYSIDNLSLSTVTSARAGEGDTNTTSIKFTITEPYGFSFLSNLRRARDAMEKYSSSISTELSKSSSNKKYPENATKQFFILGIRFFGYDQNGNLMSGKEVLDGNTLDPNASGNGAVFERYYDIVMNTVKFKIDGKAITYNITGESLAPSTAFSVKRGQIDKEISIEAGNVEEALNTLAEKLTQRQKELHKNSADPELYNKYFIKLIGEAKTVIGKAKLVSDADLDKFKWPGSGATNTAQSNDKTSTKNSTPKNTETQITLSTNTAIPEGISRIIMKSQFLEQGLKTVYTTALEPPKNKNSVNQKDSTSKKVLKWYNCSPQLSKAKWNPTIKDWVYDITYVIQVYETPVIDSAYANPTAKYYGPHKRYEYWYTGKNAEILSYVQELDNSYYTVNLNPETKVSDGTENPSTDGTATGDSGNGTTGPANTATVPGQQQPQSTENTLGMGKEAQNSYVTAISDPAKQAEAKITIMGDPDYLMVDSGYTEEQLYHKFYGNDGFTINPNGGQVFIEIDFKEAVDYNDGSLKMSTPGEPGTLSINESILFWDYPEDVKKKVNGISYQVLKVTSTFQGGAFKQLIEANINQFSNSSTPNQGEGREPDANKTSQPAGTTPPAGTNVATGTSTSASNVTNKDSGLKSDPTSSSPPVITMFDTPLKPVDISSISEITVPTLTGQVVDDDAASATTSTGISNVSDAQAGQEREVTYQSTTNTVQPPAGTTTKPDVFTTDFPLV